MGIIAAGNERSIAQRMVLNRDQAWRQILRDDQNGNIINNAGTVRYEDYRRLVEDVVKSREFMNVGVQDLIGRGLTIGSSIFETLVGYETTNTFEAQVSMDAADRKENLTNYQETWVPQPFFHTDFYIKMRQEGFSYIRSDSVEEAVFRVTELQDKVLFLGADLGVQVGGQSAPLYGYTNHPATIGATISDWAVPANFDSIVPEAIGLVGQLYTGGRVGDPNGTMMYVATDIWSSMEQDYSSQKGDDNVYDRIRRITTIDDVKPQKDLVDGSVSLVEMRRRTVELSVAQNVVAVPWVKNHELENGKFTIYSCMAPIIKQDRDGRGGVLYATKT